MSDPVKKVLAQDVHLQVQGVTKAYEQADEKLEILNGVDLKIEAGEIVALVGPSGSGKSTLLHILGLLDAPSSGTVLVGNKDATKLRDSGRTKLRATEIGFVYQFHHLLPEFTALENVALPQIIVGKKKADAMHKAALLLDKLGLGHRFEHRPARLSGGEQQRVAIARALANDPKVLLADEPTGNLDPDTAAEVFKLLLHEVQERQIGALIATHNMDLADQMDRVLELKGGRILDY